MTTYSISGNIIDVVNKMIFKGKITVENGIIKEITADETAPEHYILPGLIDSHVHIESSMLIPSEFARLAVVHGTTATVSDPHEIANVLGLAGVKFMIENSKKTPFKIFFGAPSCVPATPFETSGAVFNEAETEELLKSQDIFYLSEMMNFPGVIYDDISVKNKLDLAKKYHKPVDGHAPGITGTSAEKYAKAGITTDHECFNLEEALEKARLGIKIQIREGSAAKNFDALCEIIRLMPDDVMLCTDDKHADDLVKGHINLLVKKAIAKGFDLMDVIRACTYIPAKHYNLPVGLLQKGDAADFILVDNLSDFNVMATYIDGEKVAENATCLIKSVVEFTPNIFVAKEISAKDIKVEAVSNKMQVIGAIEGQLITQKLIVEPKVEEGLVVCDTEKDILKLVVLNRYQQQKPAIGFIQGFAFKKGAIASTVAHDSHNIIAVGTSDDEIARAINLIVKSHGGISLVEGNDEMVLPLPVAGLMSVEDGYKVAAMYEKINSKTIALGTLMNAPYMTLSFMALLVIPELKLSDKGLFDGNTFSFTNIFL
ncbi:MAG: adenine deaminase [Bacteroidota bacterium]